MSEVGIAQHPVKKQLTVSKKKNTKGGWHLLHRKYSRLFIIHNRTIPTKNNIGH